MKAVIWKYPLKAGETVIETLANSSVLTAQLQGGRPVLWMLVDKDSIALIQRRFRAYATGEEIPAGRRSYISTFQLPGLGLVFHVFEENPP